MEYNLGAHILDKGTFHRLTFFPMSGSKNRDVGSPAAKGKTCETGCSAEDDHVDQSVPLSYVVTARSRR
jgi:hypothetical protein